MIENYFVCLNFKTQKMNYCTQNTVVNKWLLNNYFAVCVL